MRLTAALLQEVVDAARAALPNEAVGLLVGAAGPERYVMMRNASASPYRYSIDPAEQLRIWTELEASAESVAAIVHSHVASAAEPSKTDIELAYFPESLYLICSLAKPDQPEIRAWSIHDGDVTEVAVDLTI
ncbi:MAG TPA: M67 family metallopeptidase [Candidatus Limnocylindria bacterium]|nr:M67 family metallopeptidase [Candidatus Limnocylindria bacterium]